MSDAVAQRPTAVVTQRPVAMRISELAAEVGVTADTIRFYEKEGWLPRAQRAGNSYRQYGPEDVDHIRLLLELRRLDLPLPDAAKLAAWCHSGHCSDTIGALPGLIAAQRRSVAGRIEQLSRLDAELARLERHLGGTSRRSLPMLESGPCCDAAAAVGSLPTACACCDAT